MLKTLSRCPKCHHAKWLEAGCSNCEKPVIAEPPKTVPQPTVHTPKQKATLQEVIDLLQGVPRPEFVASLLLQGYSDKHIKGEIGFGYSKKIRQVIKTLHLD